MFIISCCNSICFLVVYGQIFHEIYLQLPELQNLNLDINQTVEINLQTPKLQMLSLLNNGFILYTTKINKNNYN